MIRITRIIENQDMRKIHKLRLREMKKLKKGTCSVSFNKSKTIARIIDHLGGIHTFYADPQEIFNLDALKAWVMDAFFIEITAGRPSSKPGRLRRVA
jgi:hypothetical protein